MRPALTSVLALVLSACPAPEAPDAGTPSVDAGPPPIPVIDAGPGGPEGPDTPTPFPIDRGDDEGSPGTYLGLPLRLTDNPERVGDAGPESEANVGLLCVGSRIAGLECEDFAARVRGELAGEVSARVTVVNCGITGFGLEGLEAWNDTTKDQFLWDACLNTRVPEAGLSVDEVLVVYHRAANFQTAACGFQTCEALPTYPFAEANYFRMVENLDRFATRAVEKLPSLMTVFTSSRPQGHFVDVNVWRDEPLTYEEGHAVNTWLRENPSRSGVAFVWGPYLWGPRCDAGGSNAAGICWSAEDFSEDGETPTASGLAKASQLLHERLRQSGWYSDLP